MGLTFLEIRKIKIASTAIKGIAMMRMIHTSVSFSKASASRETIWGKLRLISKKYPFIIWFFN